MYSHGFHLILYAVTYGAFLNFVSSYCSRLIFRDAIQRHRNFMRGSITFALFVMFSLPLFIIGMQFVSFTTSCILMNAGKP